MDPNEALRWIRSLVQVVDDATQGEGTEPEFLADAASDLAKRVRDLDEWLSRGGFPPEAWREGPDAFGEEPAPEWPTSADAAEAFRVFGDPIETPERHRAWHVVNGFPRAPYGVCGPCSRSVPLV